MSRLHLALHLALCVGISALSALPAAAQPVRVTGAVDHPANRILAEILERNRYTLVERDTVIGRGEVVGRDLLIVRADVRLEGRVEGSVAVVGGILFTRPGSHIEGEIASIGGEVYRSGLAHSGELHELPLEVEARLDYSPGAHQVTLTGPPPPARFAVTGPAGIALPTYDRVNGLTLRVGGRALIRRDTVAPLVRGSLSFSTVRRAVGGTLGLEVPLGGGSWLVGEVARETFTNEGWIRGPLMNSLGAFFMRSDLRNYYASDLATLRYERRQRLPLVAGESFLGPRAAVRYSRDRSLDAANVYSVLGSEAWRENPMIADGEVASVVVGALTDWRGMSSRFTGEADLEWAPGILGDFEFAQIVGGGIWTMQALWRHRISIRGRAMAPFGSDGAPPQRWSIIGGAGTIPTLPVGAMRGDHLAFVETIYDVPIAGIQVPVLGSPTLRFVHATGAAWVAEEGMPPWEQSVGVGLRFFLVEALLHVDPAAARLRPTLSIGAGF